MNQIYIVFDGPPGHESGRFVEVEDGEGNGLGEVMTGASWSQCGHHLWRLGPFLPSNTKLVEILEAMQRWLANAPTSDGILYMRRRLAKALGKSPVPEPSSLTALEEIQGGVKSGFDLSPLLSEISALRLEMRAAALLTLAAAADNHASKDDYLDQAFKLQGCADQVAEGSK